MRLQLHDFLAHDRNHLALEQPNLVTAASPARADESSVQRNVQLVVDVFEVARSADMQAQCRTLHPRDRADQGSGFSYLNIWDSRRMSVVPLSISYHKRRLVSRVLLTKISGVGRSSSKHKLSRASETHCFAFHLCTRSLVTWRAF
jgi:hypothetical protein